MGLESAPENGSFTAYFMDQSHGEDGRRFTKSTGDRLGRQEKAGGGISGVG